MSLYNFFNKKITKMKIYYLPIIFLAIINSLLINCFDIGYVYNDSELRKTFGPKMLDIKFKSTWSPENGHVVPSGRHFSPAIAITHRVNFKLFEPGDTIATDGIKNMAEEGSTSKLLDEIERLIKAEMILDVSVARGVVTGIEEGKFKRKILVNPNFPYITIVSMIAPSPDWFIAIRNIPIYSTVTESGNAFEANVYDAGTDSGEEFDSNDNDTKPRTAITTIKDRPLGDGTKVSPSLGFYYISLG